MNKYVRPEMINETFEEKFENDQSILQRKERDKESEMKQKYHLDQNLIFPYS